MAKRRKALAKLKQRQKSYDEMVQRLRPEQTKGYTRPGSMNIRRG